MAEIVYCTVILGTIALFCSKKFLKILAYLNLIFSQLDKMCIVVVCFVNSCKKAP